MSDPKPPTFQQLYDGPLFALERTSKDNGWVGFLFTNGAELPTDPFTTRESFEQSGHYLLAPAAPALEDKAGAEAFAKYVRQWLDTNLGGNGNFRSRAVVWLASAKSTQFGLAGHIAVSFAVSGGGGTATGTDLNVPIGAQITLTMPRGTIVGSDSHGRGLVFGGIGGGGVDFVSSPDNHAPTVDSNRGLLLFFGHGSGCMRVSGNLYPDATLKFFQAGIRYWYRPSGDADGPEAADGRVEQQSYPLFRTRTNQSAVPYTGLADPLDPTNCGPNAKRDAGIYRTIFALAPGSAHPLESWLRSDGGRSIALVPTGAEDDLGAPTPFSGGVVPQYTSDTGDRIYLTPAGDFALKLDGRPVSGAGAGQPMRLLPGLFGSEGLQLRAYATDAPHDRLRAKAGMPALAPVFPFEASNLADTAGSSDQQLLTGERGTAWFALVNGDGGESAYLAQPEGDALYGAQANGPSAAESDGPATLPAFATPAALPQDPHVYVPMACYAGLSADGPRFPAAMLTPFESQILASVRKRAVSTATTELVRGIKHARRKLHAAQGAAGDQSVPTTTPQGLLAHVSKHAGQSDYQSVLLALSELTENGETSQKAFGFGDLGPELQDLFQTNQLFCVIVNPAHLGQASHAIDPGKPTFANEVSIADWLMTAAVGEAENATDYANVMVLKFCDGTLQDRARNPQKWTATNNFSVSSDGSRQGLALTGLSSWLQSYLDDGVQNAHDGNTLYDNFADIVTDPNWNGVLVLRSKVDPSGFPDQIKGLVAGIDFTRFRAHHFGATASHVTIDKASGTLKMKVPSSLFGLIDYQLPAYAQNVRSGGNPDVPLALPVDGDFGFTVLQLQALFENAALVDFRSHVQLSIAKLFGSPVTAAHSVAGELPTSAVVLRGRYQRQGDTPVYVFEQDKDVAFALDSNILPTVTLRRVLFNTLSAGEDGVVRSRFLMWGLFGFAVLTATREGTQAEVDLLSFGMPPDAGGADTPAGLAFSDLEVDMSSPLSSPNAVTFTFETGRLALDQGASTAREHSLFDDLALQIEGFVAGSEDKRPIDHGYLPMTVDPKQQKLSGPWYGISYKVTMGTPGALVSGAGFSSRLLAAWSPQTGADADNYASFVGLQLPGAAPGAKLMSLQGVLKLTINALTLGREPVAGKTPAFVLRMNDVGLTFLGIAKLPPGSTINFFLFGDPSGSGSLGWYAAYVKDKKKDKEDVGNAEVAQLTAPKDGTSQEREPSR